MKASSFGIGLIAAALALGAANAQSIVQESAEDWAHIAVPGMNCVLANNVWDRKIVPDGFAQSVFLEKHGNETLPGWRWNAPGKRETVLSMPELICGDKPWDEPQHLHAGFPFRAGEKKPHAAFDIEVEAQGHYNMAFSFWAVSKLPAVKANISHEIMIWTVNSGMKPGGTKIGSLEVGGTVFDLYFDDRQGVITGPDPFTWTLISFVARKPLTKGKLDFGPFIECLLARQILTRDHILTSLELGDEVSEGTGRVVVRKLELGIR